MKIVLAKGVSPLLVLALTVPLATVTLLIAKPVEAGCGCGGGSSGPTTNDITMDVSPSLGGLVRVGEELISCYPDTSEALDGTMVTFEATPALGYVFDEWSGDLTGSKNPIEVKIYRNMVITAKFNRGDTEVASEDGRLKAVIPGGCSALDEWSGPLVELTFTPEESPPPVAEDQHIVGQAYRLGPEGATFDPAIILTWRYESSEIPDDIPEESLTIVYYDESGEEWLPLSSTVGTENSQVTASVDHLSLFTLLGYPLLEPAAFSASSLSIYPEKPDHSETVFVMTRIANTGQLEGSYTVTLKIDGADERTKEVTLAAGSEGAVVFTLSRDDPGSYSVDVDGLTGSFTVVQPPPPPPVAAEPTVNTPSPQQESQHNWWLLGGILAAVAVAIAVPLSLRRRRISSAKHRTEETHGKTNQAGNSTASTQS